MTSDISSDLVHNQARSMEGRGLSMKAGERWVDIQKHTFLNWVNLQLQGSGLAANDPETDFDDGVKLCALVEALQNRKIGRVIKKPINQHQHLENNTLALNAIAADNVRLVNIGPEDIANGSTKLILGLIWTLILRYQIGKTKIPPKKLMLAWLKAVVPECSISNFTSDWNDGVALHALIDYCQPGLCPDWRQLSRSDRLQNCTEGMELAKEKLNIPIVVRPEDFSSSHLDDLSGMTYLSYFMMVDAPGYLATRREIRALLQEGTIDNFSTDWNDGRLLASLVRSVGGGDVHVTGDHTETLQNGLDAASLLGISPIFSAKEIADPEVEHLGVMAYAAYFRKFEPVKIKVNSANMEGSFEDVQIRREKHFTVWAEGDTNHNLIRTELIGPDSIVPVHMDWIGDRADCYFTPTETGHHKLSVWCDDNLVAGSPASFKVLSDRSKVSFGRLDSAVVGVNNEMTVNTAEAGEGEVRIEAESPSGRVQNFPVMYKNGVHLANFAPSEVGDWTISMIYEGEHVDGSPYTLTVVDPSLVQVTEPEDVKAGQEAVFVGSPFASEVVDTTRVSVTGEGLSLVPVNTPAVFTIHTEGAGGGKVNVDITGELTAYCMGPTKVAYCELSDHHDGTYRLAVRAQEVGPHVLQIKYGGEHVQGSPIAFKVSAQPDASKVRVSGPGVEHGLLANFQSNFVVETKGAGAGQLTVRIRGPRGAFQVEMYRESHKDRTILCRYYPTVTGLYIINVRWSGVDVPGSPFNVYILDTHQELEQVLREQGFTANGHHHVNNQLIHHHNSINNNPNMVNHSRAVYHHHQHQHQHLSQHSSQHQNHHNTSRNSGFYAWRGDD